MKSINAVFAQCLISLVALTAPGFVTATSITTDVVFENGAYTYNYEIVNGDAEVVTEWLLPLLDGDSFDMSTASVNTPDFWVAELHSVPHGSWSYASAKDANSSDYGENAVRFDSVDWVLGFRYDENLKTQRIAEIDGLTASLTSEVELDMMQLQVIMSKRNQALEMISNLEHESELSDEAKRLLLEMALRRRAELDQKLTTALNQIKDKQAQRQNLIEEKASLESSAAGIGLHETLAGFSFVSPYDSIMAPALLTYSSSNQKSVGALAPMFQSGGAVPEPGLLGLLSIGLSVLGFSLKRK